MHVINLLSGYIKHRYLTFFVLYSFGGNIFIPQSINDASI